MAFVEVNQRNAVDIKAEGSIPVQGVYLGVKNIQTDYGEQYIYRFKQPNGSVLGVYGFTNLNKGMESVATGTMVRLTYEGTKKVDTRFGKNKPVHQVKIEIDEDAGEDVKEEDEDL